MYVIVILVSLQGSVHHITSLYSFFAYVTPVLFFIGLVQLIHRRSQARVLVLIFLFYGFCLSLYGLFQYIDIFPHGWWSTRGNIAASYVNKNHFGGFLEMVLFLCLGQVFYGKKFADKVLCTVFALVMLLTLFLTQSKGALISFFCASSIFFYLLFFPKKAPRFSVVALFCLCLVLVFFIFNRISMVSHMSGLQKNNSLSVELNSWQSRESVWRSTAEMIKEHPLTGVGLGNYELSFPQYRGAGMDKLVDYAHNDFIQFVAEVGVFGILVILFFTYRLFSETFDRLDFPDYPRYYRGIVIGAFCGLISIWFHTLLDFNLQIPANALIA